MILILGTPDKGIKSGPFSKTFVFLSHVPEGRDAGQRRRASSIVDLSEWMGIF